MGIEIFLGHFLNLNVKFDEYLLYSRAFYVTLYITMLIGCTYDRYTQNSHSNNIFIANSNVACLIMQFFPFPFPFNIALFIFYVDPEKISEQLQLPLRKQ